MTNRIFRSIFFAAVIATVLTAGLIFAALLPTLDSEVSQELSDEADILAQSMQASDDPLAYLTALTTANTRQTWIAADGKVLYDSEADATALPNHADRPEVSAALANGSGRATRHSDTGGQTMLYYALRLSDGSVLRLATARSSVMGLLVSMVAPFFLILILAAALSALLAHKMAGRIVRPINQLDLEHPEHSDVYPELSPLLLRMCRQNQRIREQLEEQAARQRESAAITRNMREGLVLLDAGGNILSANRAALALFGREGESLVGQNSLALSRNAALQAAVQGAQAGDAAQAEFAQGERWYRVLVNPVEGEQGSCSDESGAPVAGSVLLILDTTEKHNAEKLRREFTANVSHELKTPLTSISGYAEIMENGLARPQDTASFAGRIRQEAQRLIALVQDILRLSRLDEGNVPCEHEDVELLSLANEVADRLRPLADSRHIRMQVQGQTALVRGARVVLLEMVENLCDNAIQYNVEGGQVDIQVSDSPCATLTVADTGVGIPPQYQDKVFERFFRVDTSHARQTGGTGLGLSIVKHGAQYHGANLTLESTPGVGTAVTLTFPPLPAD